MQATHYVPDEIERKHGHREECTLEAHHDFAAEVLGEKMRLTQPQVVQQGHTIFHDLLTFTADRPHFFLTWSLEFFFMIFVLMVSSMEMWGACGFDFGLSAQCRYCYSTPFLVFCFGLVVLVGFNLYTFVLLVTRGFHLNLRTLGLSVARNKGIPPNAIYFFFGLTIALLLWLVGGILVLIASNECTYGGKVQNRPGRSGLLFAAALLGVVLTPFLLFFGRCDDALYCLPKVFRRGVW